MILKGDCISVMRAMKPNSVDAVVCDPPYGIEREEEYLEIAKKRVDYWKSQPK